jgi:urea transport system permease protein
MAVPFSIEMVIWVAVGGRGTLIGAVLGAVLINYAKSLVSEQLPETWLFIQGGLFLLVVTALPDGLVGWWRQGGPRQIQAMVGWPPVAPTYPGLDLDPAVQAEREALGSTPGGAP